MTTRIAIIGDGAMATLCSLLLHESGCGVRLYSAFTDFPTRLARDRVNERYLPGVQIPQEVEITVLAEEAFEDAELAVSAVPTQYLRGWWGAIAGACPSDLPVCSVTKGIENDTLLRPTDVIADVLDGGQRRRPLAVLSGPCIAPEVARRQPATVIAAAEDASLARRVQELFSLRHFRVYTNDDPLGVELAGATKNVIAIAAGILDGLELGDNAKAALLTRGLVEITRLGEALGACRETFSGLAGVGDLVTTCFSPVGRNRSFGERIGRGEGVQRALEATVSVVEGVATSRSVMQLARANGVDMPIARAIHQVLFDLRDPREVIGELMTRPLKSERV